jgi:Ser-tRNA(Ala) deacylase AlaX
VGGSDDEKVVDLVPRIRFAKQRTCKHLTASVAMTEASLTCDDCDAEIDPWWYLRVMAERSDDVARDQAERMAVIEADYQKAYAQYAASVERMNADILEKNSRINHLNSLLTKLRNTEVNGTALRNYTRNGKRRV